MVFALKPNFYSSDLRL